ncbi:dual specificity phosphatase, catalytic domain protein [Elysia marginata]|uniref:Dual specificity phosphatase, catalytic domain protein n=1 Tax=Elysia marginata TaxID=1093978 RepID=A0AAV4F7U6_9GAST|nr:dual specificity phosphatase, catalytic domain protein [Elysia marginata]
MDSFKILWVNPKPQLEQKYIYKEYINFRLCIRTGQAQEHSDFIVRIWTNLYHKENNEGEWHVVEMKYQNVAIKSDSGTVDYLYGADLMVTSAGQFGFNYRAVSKKLRRSERSNTQGKIEVKPSSEYHSLTEWTQSPVQTQITNNIWLGNHAAALDAPQQGYDCLLNTSDNAPVFVLQLNRPIILRKFPIPMGVKNVIGDKKLHTAVRWLWEASLRCEKILVFSKHGSARAASLMIAYIYARNPDLTFEEAVKFVDSRCPIHNQKGLKSSLENLYPRG